MEKKISSALGRSEKSPTDVAVVDAVFICDCTGSMSSYMDKAKDTARQILSDIKAKYENSSVFFGFVGYTDHCESKVLTCMDLTGDIEAVVKFISGLRADGGRDEAEAVVDALDYAAHKISWRPGAVRQLIHILDAPPHGKEFGGGDDHPEGCPCKLDYKKILKELDAMGTEYLVLNFTPSVDKMVSIYKQYHTRVVCVPLVIQPVYPQQACPPLMYGATRTSMTAMGMMMPPPCPAASASAAMSYDPAMMMQQEMPGGAPIMMQQELYQPGMAGMPAPSMPQMDITSQVTAQMAQNISDNVFSNVSRRFVPKKK